MHTMLSLRKKNILRLFAWTCVIGVVWAIFQDVAFAQGKPGHVELEEPGFLSELRNAPTAHAARQVICQAEAELLETADSRP